jgi:tRNA pseudouridine38-40 synthase
MKLKENCYKISLMYDGSKFYGFQIQGSDPSIQLYLEKSLSIFFATPVSVRGASRTDSGVHAYGQVASFCIDREFEQEKWLSGFNALLPKEICITSIRKVQNNFHPIIDAKAKLYRYTMWKGRCFNPFIYPYLWTVPANLDLDTMRDSLGYFVGSKDFSSFCNSDTQVVNKVRLLHEIKMVQRGDCIDLWFYGEGFLKQMIRIIVGTLVDVSLGKINKADIEAIITSKNRIAAGRTAPAKGLVLMEVFYGKCPENINDFIQTLKDKYFFKF